MGGPPGTLGMQAKHLTQYGDQGKLPRAERTWCREGAQHVQRAWGENQRKESL